MKLKEKELWLELYEIAEKIQKLEPWKYLWDMDLLVYLCQPLNEIFYCSVMGHGGMHRAIAIYKGEQINGFFELAKNQILINYFYKMGRPKSIYVRDEETKMYLKDILDKAKIKIIIKPKLKAIDEYYCALRGYATIEANECVKIKVKD